MKAYSLVGKKLVECNPDNLLTTPVGMLVDEKDEMIRLIFTADARKKQRELLTQLSAEFNKNEHAGTYLVSHLENPDLVKSILAELKTGKPIEEQAKPKPAAAPSKKKAKKGKKSTDQEEVGNERSIMERWDPELVKKAVSFLDGKNHASLIDIQNHLQITEGEAYWLVQDLIHIGTLPGRWIGYSDGQWIYQIISDQPLTKTGLKEPEKKKASK